MAKNLIIAFLAVLSLALGGYIFLQSFVDKARLTSKMGNLRFLQLAVQEYSKEAIREKKRQFYPRDLQDLITENYLTTGDMRKALSGITVNYTPPKASSDIILTTHYDRKKLSVPLEGEIRIEIAQ